VKTHEGLYRRVVPVATSHHAGCAIETQQDYAFARELDVVPLMATEVPSAALDYPVVFVRHDDQVLPVALLGLGQHRNLFLDDQDRWTEGYVPAFIRRYPFILTSHDGQSFTLCVDEACPGFNREGRGKRLFDEAGKPAPYTDRALAFLKACQQHFARTRAACKRLDALDLFEPMHARLRQPEGGNRLLTGFLGVRREALAALSDDALADLARRGHLELIHAHLHSLGNLAKLQQRAAAPDASTRTEAVPPQTGTNTLH